MEGLTITKRSAQILLESEPNIVLLKMNALIHRDNAKLYWRNSQAPEIATAISGAFPNLFIPKSLNHKIHHFTV